MLYFVRHRHRTNVARWSSSPTLCTFGEQYVRIDERDEGLTSYSTGGIGRFSEEKLVKCLKGGIASGGKEINLGGILRIFLGEPLEEPSDVEEDDLNSIVYHL